MKTHRKDKTLEDKIMVLEKEGKLFAVKIEKGKKILGQTKPSVEELRKVADNGSK